MIGTTKLTNYPSQFKAINTFFQKNEKDFFLSKSWIFSTRNKSDISIINYSPINIELKVNSSEPDTIVIQQNYYKYWMVNSGVRKKTSDIINNTFIGSPVEKGINHMTFYYSDRKVTWGLIYCLTVLLSLTLLSFKGAKIVHS